MKILIDCGHGSDTPGKQSPDAALGKTDSPYWYKEWIGNRRVGCAVADLLMFQGYDVELLVTEEKDVPLSERVRRANKIYKECGGDCILVSVHSNAAAGGDKEWKDNAGGFSIYTCRGVTKSDYLATEIWYKANEELPKYGFKARKKDNRPLGFDFEEDFAMVARTFMPAVLCECLFHTNRKETLFLNSQEGVGVMAYIISEGIINYLQKYGN